MFGEHGSTTAGRRQLRSPDVPSTSMLRSTVFQVTTSGARSITTDGALRTADHEGCLQRLVVIGASQVQNRVAALDARACRHRSSGRSCTGRYGCAQGDRRVGRASWREGRGTSPSDLLGKGGSPVVVEDRSDARRVEAGRPLQVSPPRRSVTEQQTATMLTRDLRSRGGCCARRYKRWAVSPSEYLEVWMTNAEVVRTTRVVRESVWL